MATKISDTAMTSDGTKHTAPPAEGGRRTAPWLQCRTLTQSHAITAMTIADARAVGAGAELSTEALVEALDGSTPRTEPPAAAPFRADQRPAAEE